MIPDLGEARFRTMFEGAAIGIMLEDLEGHFVETNPALQAMLGYSAEELRGLHFSAVVHPEDISAGIEEYLELVAGKRDRMVVESRYSRKDGTYLWMRNAISLGCNAAGEPSFVIVTARTSRRGSGRRTRFASWPTQAVFWPRRSITRPR